MIDQFDDRRAVCGLDDLSSQKIHLRRADEAGDETVARVVVEIERRADLLDHAGVEDDDPVASVIASVWCSVRHVDHRDFEFLVQPRQFDPHLHPQFGVEIAERLVEQEKSRLSAMMARPIATRLALAAGELAVKLALEQFGDAQCVGRAFDPPRHRPCRGR